MINHTSPLLGTVCFWQALLFFKNQARVMDLCMAIVRHVRPVPKPQASVADKTTQTRPRQCPATTTAAKSQSTTPFFSFSSFFRCTYNVQIGTVGRVQILVSVYVLCEFYIWYILWSDWKQLHHDCYTCQHVVCRDRKSVV